MPATTKPFKDGKSLKERQALCQSMLTKHAGKIPMIVEKSIVGCDLPDLDRCKFLVDGSLTFMQFRCVVLGKIRTALQDASNKTAKVDAKVDASKKAIFFFVGGGKHLPGQAMTLNELYKQYKDEEDGLLYITYHTEDTFG
jgi:Autophagy protein Atg8 ubiquitin like